MENTLNTGFLEQPLKRLLRRQDSGEYLKDGEWTKNPDEALSFSEQIEAARACARYGLHKVELVLRAHGGDVFCTRIC